MFIDTVELRWLVGSGNELLADAATSSALKSISAFALFILVVYLEARNGAVPSPLHDIRQSYYTNLGVFLFNEATLAIIPLPTIWSAVDSHSAWGLLWPVSNRFVRGVLALVLLDFMLYAWHRAVHSYDVLWTFHRIHHNDRCMNASTSFRIHGVELLCTIALKMIFMIVVGVDSGLMSINEGIATVSVVLHHTNLRLPRERLLGLLFVVPAQHRAHHSALRSEHDRNYGAIFSVWDRWFGTLTMDEPATLGLANVDGLNLGQLFWEGLPGRSKVAVWASRARSAAHGWMGSLGCRVCLCAWVIRPSCVRRGRFARQEAHRSRRARLASRLVPGSENPE